MELLLLMAFPISFTTIAVVATRRIVPRRRLLPDLDLHSGRLTTTRPSFAADMESSRIRRSLARLTILATNTHMFCGARSIRRTRRNLLQSRGSSQLTPYSQTTPSQHL